MEMPGFLLLGGGGGGGGGGGVKGRGVGGPEFGEEDGEGEVVEGCEAGGGRHGGKRGKREGKGSGVMCLCACF